MNAVAHDSAPTSLDNVINLWPDDPGEGTVGMAFRQGAAMFAAAGVALAGLVAAIVLQTVYHGAILLWILFGARPAPPPSRCLNHEDASVADVAVPRR